MKYLFIDSTEYKRLNFDLDNLAIKQLIYEIEIDEVCILTCEIQNYEMLRRLHENSLETKICTEKLIRSHKNSKSLYQKFKKTHDTFDEFHSEVSNYEKIDRDYLKFFSEKLQLITIPLDGINIHNIFERRHYLKPPFEKKKDNEYADAFIIEALKLFVEEGVESINIITMDKGFKAAISHFYQFKHFESLDKFLSFIQNEKERQSLFSDYLNENQNILEEMIREQIDYAPLHFYLDEIDSDIIEYTIESIYFDDFINIGDSDIDTSNFYSNINLSLVISTQYISPEDYMYDKEDDKIYFIEYTHEDIDFEIKTQISIKMTNLEETGIEIESIDVNLDDSYEIKSSHNNY